MKIKLIVIVSFSVSVLYAKNLATDVYDFCNDCNTNRNGISMQSIANWGFVDWHTNHPEFKAIVNTISNDYTQVLSSLSQFQTNENERAVLFHAIPYAGFDAWTNVWYGMLSIAETNQTVCPIEWVGDIAYAATTPLEYYMIYNYKESFVSNSLVRMITLVGEDNEREKEAYLRVQSGEHKQYKIEVYGMPTNRCW